MTPRTFAVPLIDLQLFELVMGFPPFDNIIPTKTRLARQWISMFGLLPKDWHIDPEILEPNGESKSSLAAHALQGLAEYLVQMTMIPKHY